MLTQVYKLTVFSMIFLVGFWRGLGTVSGAILELKIEEKSMKNEVDFLNDFWMDFGSMFGSILVSWTLEN